MSISSPLADGVDAWFGRPARHEDSRFLLFCLPYSGAGPSVFEAWSSHLPATVRLLGVRLPGREQRIAEPIALVPRHIAAAIASRADRPYAIYGHSLGARLGFEVLRSLRRMDAPPPALFYAAAARPPDVADPIAASVELSDDGLLDALITRLSAPVELRDEPELREMLLPVLRADLTWIHRYRYDPEPPLDVPIVALAGDADTEVGAGDMLGWGRHTTAPFEVRTIPGDHFFLRTAAVRLAAMAVRDLRSAATDDPPGMPR